MIGIDTSIWIDYFRGKSEVISEVNELLDEQSVLLPTPVWIELLSGASKRDLPLLRYTLSALPRATPTKSTWKTIETWIAIASKRGKRFGFADLLIAAICSEADAKVWSLDDDFAEMSKLKLLKRY